MNGQAFRAFLLSQAALSALVDGTRVYPVVLPQATDFPAVTYQVITEQRDYKQEGDDSVPTRRVQVDLWANTYDETEALYNALRQLSGTNHVPFGSPAVYFNGVFFDNARDLYEAALDAVGPRLYRKSIDMFVTTTD